MESALDDVDDITDSSATLNGAAIGWVSIRGIVGNSGISIMDFGGRPRHYVDTDAAVKVDRRGSSITTPRIILIVDYSPTICSSLLPLYVGVIQIVL